MTRKAFFAVIALSHAAVLPLHAQQNASSTKVKVSAPAATGRPASSAAGAPRGSQGYFDPNFPLMPGDSLSVTVANHPEFSVSEIPIAPNGKVTLPYIGSVPVAGKKIGELQGVITKALSSQLRRPSVAVNVVRSRPREATVLGAVGRTGGVELRSGWRVSELIAAAGGLTADPEDVTATLKRGNSPAIALKLNEILRRPESNANVTVRTGDVINVVSLPTVRVIVNGDVNSTGTLKLPRSARVLDAIVGSGGLAFRPQETKASLVRGGQVQAVDIEGLFNERVNKANIGLKDGDLLTFEAMQANVSVVSLDNLVQTPGIYQMKGDATALRAILMAGGLVVPAENVVATIHRGSETIPVNLVAAAATPESDVPLKNGDILTVAAPAGPRVRIAGAVGTPGVYTFREGSRLLDAVLQVGGLKLTPGGTSLNVLRTLPNGRQTRLTADAKLLFEAKDLGQNLLLQDGDVVLINEASKETKTVFIAGEVATPGAYEVTDNEGVIEALLRAGGATPKAALSRVNVKHNGQLSTVDLSGAFSDGGQVPQLTLAAGDVINVPENKSQVLVMNAVAKPGYVAIPENGVLTLGDALLMAGGPSDRAKLKEVAILTPKGNNQVERRLVSLDAVASGNLTINEPLRPGDIVWVPRAKDDKKSLWSTVTSALGTVGIVAGLAN